MVRYEVRALPAVGVDRVNCRHCYWSETQEVDIHVQKVRFKHIGRIGATTLNYDRVTGRYWEPRRDGNVVYSMVREA